MIQKLKPVLTKVLVLLDKKCLLRQDVEELMRDATEQTVELPKRDQKAYYSGKKKRYTLKTEICPTLQGLMSHVYQSCPGFVHDFALHQQELSLPPKSRVYVDSGYQGLDKIYKATELPYKKSKHHPLHEEETL